MGTRQAHASGTTRHPAPTREGDTMGYSADEDFDHVPTDQEAADARLLLSLPDDERRMLMDLRDAREAGELGS
jgi:hypothetical protein